MRKKEEPVIKRNLDDWISEFSVQVIVAFGQLTKEENLELADALKQIAADLELRAESQQ